VKRKIFSILFALVIVLSFSLVTAVPAVAQETFSNPGYTFQMLTDNAVGGAEKVCNPSFSPDGTRIVYMKGIYDGSAQIWVMKSDGTEKQRIDNGNGYEGVPFWSSDGNRIIWEGGVDEDRSAMAVDVTITGGDYSYSTPYVFFHLSPEEYAAQGIENVSSDGLNCCNPSWFPGSDKIVFWVFFTNDQADLFAYERSTDTLERITDTPDYSDYEPKVSPDGSKIIYWSGETATELGPNVHTIPTTGWPITTAGILIAEQASWPTYSRDGTMIAFSHHYGTGYTSSRDIYIADATGNFKFSLTNMGDTSKNMGYGGEWGPNGEFVFTSYLSGFRNIWLSTPKTSDYVYVDGVGYFATIQSAINAANPSDTIDVAAGTYQEKLTVTKSLTFVGEDTAWPTLDIPEGDDGGITVTVSDVSFENFHFYRQDQEYHTGGFNSIVSVPRGGTWPNYTIEYERVTFRNILFEGARRAAFITAGDLTIEDCEFRDQLRDSLFLANLSGTTNILRNYFAGATDTKKAIVFENHSDADPGVSGTINIIDNTCVGKNNFLVYNQWLFLDQKVTLNINGNDIQNTGSTAIDIYNLNPEEWQGKFDSITASLNSFTGIPDGEYAICNRSTDIAVDATHNWWGNASGPAHTSNSAGTGASVSDGVNFIPWLGAEVGTTPMPVIEPVTGADPPPVEIADETGEPIATVDISDGNAAQGTIAGYIEPDDPEPGGTSLAVGTGKEGAFFLDVKVTGYTSGTAHITVPYPDEDDDGIVDSTGIVETTLGLYYWDETASMWRLAANSTVDAVNNTLSGDIPVSALTGTPIGGGGYPADEATIAIESITNLSYSGNDIVDLTITTKTAKLGAATIDLTFNNTVVKVLGGENSDFDSLTVNPDIARFVANQLGAAGVDATSGAVLAQVRLKAVGATGSSSSLTLGVVTLKDNDGIAIPVGIVTHGTASIGGLGDANSDGAVDVYDCVYTARAIAGISGYTLNILTMDVDGSGEVDAFDCTYLARHIAGIVGYEQLGG